MRKFFFVPLLLLTLSTLVNIASAQERCATVEQTEALYKRFNKVYKAENFERWLSQRPKAQAFGTLRKSTNTYRIPVVVHIIHNGEPIGAGINISDEQILSQINVLNKDFQRLNSDANQTPQEFEPFAGNLSVKFILARQDPTGNPSTGIVRVRGNKTSYNDFDDVLLKSESYWPSEDYLNIWVCNLNVFLGYAQFPISNLEGLEEYQNELAETDGVVVTYEAFGSDDDGAFDLLTAFNKGRTLTHEVGHFLGLRHIWGDVESCATTTDYVDDTPPQSKETRGCPTHPQLSCNTTKMFQNFMDYSNDRCMNLFTNGQVERMVTVLENSIRRASLLTSPGLNCPSGECRDLVLSKILSPEVISCEPNNVLRLQLQNRSGAPLTEVKVVYSFDDENPITIPSYTINPAIAEGNLGEIAIPILLSDGQHLVSASVNFTSGEIDDTPEDNFAEKKVMLSSREDFVPLRERFEPATLERWPRMNPSSATLWEPINTNFDQSISFVGSMGTEQEESWLASPVLDFNFINKSNLRFDWSYRNNSSKPTFLQLKYSTDCGLTYLPLPGFTFTSTSSRINPVQESDWETAELSLSSLVGFSHVQLAFIAKGFNGNAVYIDNLDIFPGEISPTLSPQDLLAVYGGTNGTLRISFNFEDSQHVRVNVLDGMGRPILTGIEPRALNQTLEINVSPLSTGIYIVQVVNGTKFITQKVFIQGQ
jgi:hypothetical protein